MTKQPSSVQNYCDQEEELFLSTRITTLKMSQPKINFLQTIGLQSSDKTSSEVNSNEKSFKSNCLKSNHRPKPANFAKMHANQAKINLEEIRLFEIMEEKNHKKILTEIKDTKICQFSGKGMLILNDATKYEGLWDKGNLSGQVKISYPNGDIYVGEVSDYQEHGKGHMYFSAGEKYVGEFNGGIFHGEGSFYNRQGDITYEGQWYWGEKI